MVAKWRDKREVTYISTEFPNNLLKMANRRDDGKETPCPITEYNKNMGGVDKVDQMMSV